MAHSSRHNPRFTSKSLRDKSHKISNSGLLEKLLDQSHNAQDKRSSDDVKAKSSEKILPTVFRLK